MNKMIDTDKYMEDVDEVFNLIMNLMDDEEREFQIKTRIRERNRYMIACIELKTEVIMLQHKLMLAESALGEIRAYHESGQGNLGEIIEHYQKNEQVEMPNIFDETKKD